MESQKISNLLNEASNSQFVTRKWNIVNDLSNVNYAEENGFICSTEVWKPNLYNFNDACIVVRRHITKIDWTTIEYTEDFGPADIYFVRIKFESF